MSRVSFHRPARFLPPPTPADKVQLPAPPESKPPSAGFISLLLPLISSLGIAAYMVSYGRPMLIALAIMFAVVSFAATIAFRVQNRHNERRATMRQRARYRALLMDARTSARQVASAQRMLGAWAHPEPQRLLAIATSGRRVWERRQTDPDFLKVRIGLGDADLSTPIQIGARLDPLADYDWESMRAARRLVDRLAKVGQQPITVDLGGAGVLSVLGQPERTAALGRALLCQLAVLHAPDDVMVAIEAPDATQWEWAKWLPHTVAPESRRSSVPWPLIATRSGGLAEFLENELGRRMEHQASRRLAVSFDSGAVPAQQRLVVLFGGFDPVSDWGRSHLLRTLLAAAGPALGISLIFLAEQEAGEPERVDVRVSLGADGAVTIAGRTGTGAVTSNDSEPDQVSAQMAELIARTLTPLALTDEQEQVLARTVSLWDTLLVGRELDLALAAHWSSISPERLLKVPIGTDGGGQTVVLDLKESAQGGSGPHGLIVGATGSGKSELLRTLVAGLAVTHPPDLLSFVVVDFKGGATFAPLTDLPHVAGMITNLVDDTALVDRVLAALQGEQQRRQRQLRAAGNVDSIREYHRMRLANESGPNGERLEAMPYLLIIIDEFAELLSARPEFVDLFVQIGRLGRSLGMHLLLSTQKLEEGRLRGLDSHLSYRICLRTFSAQESRIVIGTPDAYRLPPIPGSAYLKVDESIYQRFRVAHVSGEYVAPGDGADVEAAPAMVVPYDLDGLARARLASESEEETTAELPARAGSVTTELNVFVERIRGRGTPPRQVWVPPLPAAAPLDAVLGGLEAQPGRGLFTNTWPLVGTLRVPLGVIDLPVQQRQEPLIADFGGPHGNLAIVGAPRSGRSTLLRTLMLATVVSHSPLEAQFYCIDFGGETLHPFMTAPHVGGVAGRGDEEMILRMLADLQALISERERLFRELSVESVSDFRTRRDDGRLSHRTRAADVFLLIDNWGALRTELEGVDTAINEIAARGLGVGVHLVLTANRWMEIRPVLRESIGTRMELRLNDHQDSEIDRRMAGRMPVAMPGRMLVPPGVYGHVLLPRMDGRDTDEGLREAQHEVLERLRQEWRGPGAPAVRMLPSQIRREQLGPVVDTDSLTAVPIGIGEPDIATVSLDLVEGDPHFLIFGDTGSGKSEFLRSWLRSLTEQHSGWEARVVIIDYRRSLLGIVPVSHLGAYAAESQSARLYAEQIAEKLRDRMPPGDVTPEELRARSWWEGPEIYLVVDDYDLVGGNAQGPLGSLLEFLPHARDLGFHLVLARRISGSGRSHASDQLSARIRELGNGGLVLSGDPREGALIGGVRATNRNPGRGTLVQRGKPNRTIQVAYLGDPDEAAEGSDADEPPSQENPDPQLAASSMV